MHRFLALVLLASALPAQMVPGRYILELESEPAGKAARSTAGRPRLARIAAEQGAASRMVSARGGKVLASMNALMNALAVELPGMSRTAAAALPGVKQAYVVEELHASLDRAAPLHFISEVWNWVGGPDKAGAGIKIGIVDTGISPDHPGFQDPSLQVPAGYPLVSKEENLEVTSNKIIVARNYEQFYNAREPDSARDRNGHGTAVAMTAAGVPHQGPFGRIGGMAPKAWLGAYKIVSLNSGSANSDAIMKALDDALADGMDVVNLSFGSAVVVRLDLSAIAVAIERLVQHGVIVVVSGGNSGAAPGTIGNSASSPFAISVGASDTDRRLAAALKLPGNPPYFAFATVGPVPDPISGRLIDLTQLVPAPYACNPLPDDSLTGAVALTPTGGCTFEIQLNNMQRAGAATAVFHRPDAQMAFVTPNPGEAKLPGIMISFADANAVRRSLETNPEPVAEVDFEGVSFPSDPVQPANFSSRGPTYFFSIKPDLSAVGYVETATQKIDPEGDSYARSGYTFISGTSFSSPIVAGAAAVLKALRPGLTVAQYRSLLINSATSMNLRTGVTERVMRTGPGLLNLAAAVTSTISAYPTSVAFDVNDGTLDDRRPLTLTNMGTATASFRVSGARYDGAPALTLSEDPRGVDSVESVNVQIAPRQSKTVYSFWSYEDLPPGEYQGVIRIEDLRTNASALVPYWTAVASGVPAGLTVVVGPAPQVVVGRTLVVAIRVYDVAGIPVTATRQLGFNGAVVAGGGAVGGSGFDPELPNIHIVELRMGPEPGTNTFRLSYAGLPPVMFTVQGIRAPAE